MNDDLVLKLTPLLNIEINHAQAEIDRSIADTRRSQYEGDVAALQKFSHILKDELGVFTEEEKAEILVKYRATALG